MRPGTKQWEILLVEDNPADIRLAQEAFRELQLNHRLQVVEDGIAALNYLSRSEQERPGIRPDLILLDLNLPGMSGLEVLAVIKSDESIKSIPVIILSSSSSDSDVSAAYRLNANCYTRKPLDIDRYFEVMENISRFWMETVLLPEAPAGMIH